MDSQTTWPVTIAGPGAIGLHLAFSLADVYPVELRHPRHSDALNARSRQHGQRRFICRRVDDPTPIQALVITTKAHQVVSAFEQLQPALSADACIVLLHNGLGPQQAVADRLGPNQALGAAVTTEAVRRTGPCHIVETGSGETWLGPWTGQREPNRLEQALLRSALTATWEPCSRALQQRIWEKLLVNAAINPLSALLGCANGGLTEPSVEPRWLALLPELAAIAQANGVDCSEPKLAARIRAVLRATAANRSSMLEDLTHGRRPELQAITGTLLSYASAVSVAAPQLAAVHQAVNSRFAERGIPT